MSLRKVSLKQKHLDTLRRVLLPFSEKIEKVGVVCGKVQGTTLRVNDHHL